MGGFMRYIILGLLSFLLVLEHTPAYAIQWQNAPLACLPKRAVKWTDDASKEPCHCPPQNLCPQSVAEWNDVNNHKMPIGLIMTCCNTVCPANTMQAIVYREVTSFGNGEGGGGLWGTPVCGQRPITQCGEDLGGGLYRVPFFTCIPPCTCKSDVPFNGQASDCVTSFAVFAKPALSGTSLQTFINSVKPKSARQWIEENAATANTEGAQTWVDLIDTLACPPPESGREGCVLKGTPVTLADGTTKPIEHIKVGDEVKGDKASGKVIAVSVFTQLFDTMYGINGGTPFITVEHPILTTSGWKSIDPKITSVKSGIDIAGVLQVGDVIVTSKGNLEVKSIEKHEMKNTPTALNLSIENNGSFVANDVVVKGFRQMQMHY